MRGAGWAISFLLAMVSCAFGSDQEKALKQIRMMTAMSRDDTARSIVSRTFADSFKMARPDLITERKSLGLNYGGMFLLYELTQSGTHVQQIVGELRARKTMIEISNSSHADWKRIGADAKKMNNRINDAIYKHFLHAKQDDERDQADHYNPSSDVIGADREATLDEIVKAQHDFVFWRNLAAPINGGQADRNSPMGQAYERTRQSIEDSHGDLQSSSVNQ
jgi:hypothetical protein